MGHIPGTGQLNAITEVDFEDIIGRSVVIHNTDGTRVACGNIEPFGMLTSHIMWTWHKIVYVIFSTQLVKVFSRLAQLCNNENCQ